MFVAKTVDFQGVEVKTGLQYHSTRSGILRTSNEQFFYTKGVN